MNGAAAERPAVWKEARRLRAWELVGKGWKQKDVAGALGVAKGAVSQWAGKARKGSVQALGRRQRPGGPAKLSGRQRAQLPELLTRGPSAFGFCGEIRTRRGVTWVIQEEFGVSYHPSQAGRILKGCGWSLQKLALRAAQRDGDAIREWREQRFPELKKRPCEWADEPGFTCCPPCWAPGRLGAGGQDTGNPAQAEL